MGSSLAKIRTPGCVTAGRSSTRQPRDKTGKPLARLVIRIDEAEGLYIGFRLVEPWVDRRDLIRRVRAAGNALAQFVVGVIGKWRNLDYLHHAKVLMEEDVAVIDEAADIVGEAGAEHDAATVAGQPSHVAPFRPVQNVNQIALL